MRFQFRHAGMALPFPMLQHQAIQYKADYISFCSSHQSFLSRMHLHELVQNNRDLKEKNIPNSDPNVVIESFSAKALGVFVAIA